MCSESQCWLFSNLCVHACMCVLDAEYTSSEKYDSQLTILKTVKLMKRVPDTKYAFHSSLQFLLETFFSLLNI
jgi:hypothetical protein